MKRLVSNYSFNAATKQVTLTDYTNVDLQSLLLITNVTDNVIIYNFASQGKGATVTGNVVTLDFDTTSMSNTDDLQIFIDDLIAPATETSLSVIQETFNENLVTYTYDEWDRVLYKNVFRIDVPYRSSVNAQNNSIQNIPQQDRKPKKLIYQDVYTYKNGTRKVAPSIKRVHQPVIEFSASRVSNIITLNGDITCRSKVLASGFIWSTTGVDATVAEAMMPPNYFKGAASATRQIYTGANALGTLTHTLTSASTHYVKAFAQVETGTLFSKTITV